MPGSAAASVPGSAAGAGTYGLVDGVYHGAGGFTIDPKNCPSDWNPDQGITDSSIELFMSLPTSGPLAGFGIIADGMNAATTS